VCATRISIIPPRWFALWRITGKKGDLSRGTHCRADFWLASSPYLEWHAYLEVDDFRLECCIEVRFGKMTSTRRKPRVSWQRLSGQILTSTPSAQWTGFNKAGNLDWHEKESWSIVPGTKDLLKKLFQRSIRLADWTYTCRIILGILGTLDSFLDSLPERGLIKGFFQERMRGWDRSVRGVFLSIGLWGLFFGVSA